MKIYLNMFSRPVIVRAVAGFSLVSDEGGLERLIKALILDCGPAETLGICEEAEKLVDRRLAGEQPSREHLQ